jgi:hypothetical protein
MTPSHILLPPLIFHRALKGISYNQMVTLLTADADSHQDNADSDAKTSPSAPTLPSEDDILGLLNSDDIHSSSDVKNDSKHTVLSPSVMASTGANSNMPLVHRQQIIRQFLKDTAGQFTVFGLAQLHERASEQEIFVYFRNNHFSTSIKHKGHLYSLVTDAGICGAMPNIVWQKLGDIDGSDVFRDSNFALPSVDPPEFVEQQQHLANQRTVQPGYNPSNVYQSGTRAQIPPGVLSQPQPAMQHPQQPMLSADAQMAQQLQRAEYAAAERDRQAMARRGGGRPRERRRSNSCVIL